LGGDEDSIDSGKAKLVRYYDGIECDIAIYSNAYAQGATFKSEKAYQMVHANWSLHNILLPKQKIDKYIAVSSSVAYMLKERYGVEALCIENLLPKNEVRIGTFTRIEKGKGIERIINICKILEDNEIEYTWDVFGDGGAFYTQEVHDMAKGLKNLRFYSPTDNVKQLMKDYTYISQLSDDEGFCYSAYEALMLHVPCLITEFNSDMKGFVHGEYGFSK